MLSAELRGTALVTGGGRGIGANIARELFRAGMDVWVSGRTPDEVRTVADEIGGHALVGDVSKREDVARWCGEISPGLVRTAMTEGHVPDDAPWTPPECAPRLVHALATGEFDRLAGRYLHAEHDPPDQLRERMDAILADDLNAIRLRR
jgi:hypothetical protein